MVIGADGRKRSHTLPPRADALGRQARTTRRRRPPSTARPTTTTGPLLEPRARAALGRLCGAQARPRRARSRSTSTCPSARSCSKADGTVDRVITPERLDAHRLIEEFMILANVAAAETLEQARVPLIYRVHDEPSLEKLEALREFLDTLDISLPKGGALRAEQFNRILAQVKGTRRREAGQRGGAAHAGAGRIRRRELRPFRPQPAPLRAFHLADPPLCRPDRASRADPRAEASAPTACPTARTCARWARSPRRSRPPSGAP